MRILLVNKFHFIKGGAETYYFTLAEALKKAGHEVIFFSMEHKNNFPCEQGKYFVSNKEYNKKTSIFKNIKAFSTLIYSKESYDKMVSLLDFYKPDLAILNNIHRQITTSIIDALVKHNVKIYWVVHDLILLCPNYQMLDNNHKICELCAKGNYFNCVRKKCIKNSLLKSCLGAFEAKYNFKKKIYDKIDKFITPSDFYRKKLVENGFDPSKVIHIPNPLSFDSNFKIISSPENYILYFGRLSPEKGISTLIKAMMQIDYKLVIIGTGPIEKKLIEEIKINCLDKKVIMVGFKSGDELKEYIMNSRAVIVPSEWYENGPYSAIEAMSLGKPLIVSCYGGLPELVENGKNGYIFDSEKTLVNCIKTIINQNDYNDLCKYALLKAKMTFNSEKYVERLLNDYK